MTAAGTTTAPSSTPPSSDPITGRRWLRLAAVVLLLLVLAELGTRAIASHLPPPLQWDTYETQVKAAQIDALSQRGGAQVAFVGSSIIDVGIDPATFDRAVGGHVTSYNAGLVSSIPRMTTEWTEQVVVPKLHPKVVVLGLCSYDLGAEDPNRTVFLNAYNSSSGVRQLTDDNDLIQNLDQWLGQHSALWFHKYQLRDPATVLHALEGEQPAAPPQTATVAADGRQTMDQNQQYANDPTVDLRGWRLGTKDTAAVKQLIAFDHARHITTILVNMPVTAHFVAKMPNGGASYAVFDREVAAIGHQTGASVLSYEGVNDTALFINDIHLNKTGATLLTTRLASALQHLVR